MKSIPLSRQFDCRERLLVRCEREQRFICHATVVEYEPLTVQSRHSNGVNLTSDAVAHDHDPEIVGGYVGQAGPVGPGACAGPTFRARTVGMQIHRRFGGFPDENCVFGRTLRPSGEV